MKRGGMSAAARLHSRYPHNVKFATLVYNDLVSSPRCVVQDCLNIQSGVIMCPHLDTIKHSGTLGAGCGFRFAAFQDSDPVNTAIWVIVQPCCTLRQA